MDLQLVTPPAVPAVDPGIAWEHTKAAMGEHGEPEDKSLIDVYMAAAIGRLDGDAGVIGRCLITQTWRLSLSGFTPEIEVPLPPIQSVDSLSYVDSSGAEQVLDPSAYRVSGLNGWHPARIKPVGLWPAAETVTVEFTAGYGDTPEDVPAPLQAAMLLMIGHFHSNREAVVTGTIATELPLGVEPLIAPYRTRYFR